MENTILRSDANAPETPPVQVNTPNSEIAEAARLAVEKADSERRAADEEKRKLADAEHASKVIAKANAEAKAYREKLEAEQKAREDIAKRLKELEDKELAEKEQFKTLAEKRAAELEEERAASKKALEELKAERERERAEEQAGRVLDAVTLAAVKAGILDEEDVTLPSFKEALAIAKIENGRIVGVSAAVAKMKELKPGKFKADAAQATGAAAQDSTQNEQVSAPGRIQEPQPADDRSTKGTDAAALTDEQFEALTARLRRGRA